MNGRKAKGFRGMVYDGETEERRYEYLYNQRGKYGMLPGTVRNVPGSLRSEYQRLKRGT